MNIVPMIRDANKMLAMASSTIFVFAIVIVLGVWAGNASAAEQTLVCKGYGYTNKAEDFHAIKVTAQEHAFTLKDTSAVLGDKTFVSIDPSTVGLEGLAVTYYFEGESKVLYFYMNEVGHREVGISYVEADSDAIFADKALFTDCDFSGPPTQQMAKATP